MAFWYNRAMIDAQFLPTITANRLTLRALDERDIPALFTIFSQAEVMRYWSSPPMRELADAEALLQDIGAGFQQKTLFQWGVALTSTHQVIGTCTLFHLDSKNRRAEIGYALAREQWGKGIMQEALTALVDFAFNSLDLHRIEADVDPRNHKSLRLLERLGFIKEGLLRERWLVGGEVQDSMMLGLLRREWKSGQ
ncbi:MAG: GNAT family protein [Acidobacteriota bacterium]